MPVVELRKEVDGLGGDGSGLSRTRPGGCGGDEDLALGCAGGGRPGDCQVDGQV